MSKGMNVFGILMIPFYILSNLSYALWTIWTTLEEIDTGWGYGTKMEMVAIMPWLHAIILLPLLLVGVLFFVLYIFRRSRLGVFISNVTLWSILVGQIFITWLFVMY